MLTFQEIKKIASESPDGFTVSLKGEKIPADGYVVAVKDTQDSHSDEGLKSCIEYAKKNKLHVGGWLDNTNKYYFDAVKILQNEAEAIAFAKANRQLAIFDLSNKKTIHL